jgi:hypothetical protein
VRGAYDLRVAVPDEPAAEIQRFLQIGGAVVETGKDMAVTVYH